MTSNSRLDAEALFGTVLAVSDRVGDYSWLCDTLRTLSREMLDKVRAEIGRRTSGPSNDNPEGTR